MKVAIIHFRIIRVGGLETRLFNYTRHFSERGDKVTIIHAKRDNTFQLPEGTKLTQVPVKWIPKPLRMWWFGYYSRQILQQGNYDLSLSLGRTPGQQLLICPGTHLGFLRATGRKFYFPSDYLNIHLDRAAFRSSKIIFAASEMIREELSSLYKVPFTQTRTLYPPSDPKVFNFKHRANRNELKSRFGINPQKKTFLFVSSGHNRKGLPLLMDIFLKLKDYPIHLCIAGSPPKTSIPSNASYLGFVQDMPQLYAAVEALIHPALYEPFGQIVSESLMCGTPVIVSHKTGASELIGKDEGIIVRMFEPESWIDAVKQFLEKEWNVQDGFAEKNGITLDKHMNTMIGTWKEINT